MIIAIDGPAGTGKSSVTRRLSDLLGFTHVDTGALYRALAYSLLRQLGGDPTQIHEDLAVEVAQRIQLEFKRIPNQNPINRLFMNQEDVTDFIRSPQVSLAASQISAYPGVRSALLGLQQKMGRSGNTILEGRDIGTVVFPDAEIKFFLTASIEERAKRRLAELEAMGSDTPSFEEVKQQILLRDKSDMTRAIAPLKKAPDAIELDTSLMTLDEVVEEMKRIVKQQLK